MPSHIIVVEDDDMVRYTYHRVLEEAGYTVLSFPDYQGAIEQLDAGAQVDLLVVDIVLPAGTPHGIATVAMARMRRPGLPVVFVTGYDEHTRYVLDDTVLIKPVPLVKLLGAVAARLQMPRTTPPVAPASPPE